MKDSPFGPKGLACLAKQLAVSGFGLVLFGRQSYIQTGLGGRPSLHGLHARARSSRGRACSWSPICSANTHT